MNDAHAEKVLVAVMDLAVLIRDEGPEAVREGAARVLRAAGGDPIAALSIAAAMVAVDAPVDRWWQQPGPAPIPQPKPPAPEVLHLDLTRPVETYYGPADPAVIQELVDALYPRAASATRTGGAAA